LCSTFASAHLSAPLVKDSELPGGCLGAVVAIMSFCVSGSLLADCCPHRRDQ